MDKSEIINIVKEFARIVKSKYDCDDVILFGSYGKDTNQSERF